MWDESRSAVSYDLLVKLALHFNDVSPQSRLRENVTVSTTYIDEDGDEITISSNEELIDAFGQFVNSVPPVVRAKAIVSPKEKNPEERREQAKLAARAAVIRAKHAQAVGRNRTIRAGAKNFDKADVPMVHPQVVRLPAVSVPPVAPPKRVHNVNDSKDAADTSGFDPNFIHGRHTCDGCLSTPIYGIRYHAINMPDYDLCSSCHSNYQGNDIVFKPMQLDRDRHLQSRWQRRQMRRCRPIAKAQGSRNASEVSDKSFSGTTKKVIDGMDDALKEAIRRSLVDVDAWSNKEKKEIKEPEAETETTKNVEPCKDADVISHGVKEDREENIPVARSVVEITAGNDHTQKALENMDPNVKRAISRNLNEFFARRSQKNILAGNGFGLSHDDDTQKKIDAMDDKMRESIRRSLNQFFATRRATKENQKKAAADPPVSKIESCDNEEIKRTQEALDTMDPEMREKIRRNLNDFFARRMNKNGTEATSEEEKNEIPSVVIDIVVDDDDDDLSDGTVESQANTDDTDTNISVEETKDDAGLKNSEGSLKDEWEMVTEDDKMIAMAAQMLGSALFQSDSSIDHSS